MTKLISFSHKRKLDVILLAETWLTKTSEKKLNINGYEYFGQVHTNKKGGGVGILINKNLKYRARPDLQIVTEYMENVSIELKLVNAKIIISSIYRPPNTSQKEFLTNFREFESLVNKGRNDDWIVGLDHNMDLLKYESNKNTQTFMENLLEMELYPSIT